MSPEGSLQGERRKEAVRMPTRAAGAAGCAICQPTFFPVYQHGAVGARAAFTLHSVTVSAVIVLVPEGAVLHHLFRWTHRPLAWHPDRTQPSTQGPPGPGDVLPPLWPLSQGLGKGVSPLTTDITRMTLPKAGSSNSLTRKSTLPRTAPDCSPS